MRNFAPYENFPLYSRNWCSFSTFCYICANNCKSVTAECSPKDTRKSTRISESIIAMEIRPFVSYSKWPGELGSVGYVFILCCLPYVCTFESAGPFSPILYTLYLPQNLSSSLRTLYCIYSRCEDCLVAPLNPYLYHKSKWCLFEAES